MFYVMPRPFFFMFFQYMHSKIVQRRAGGSILSVIDHGLITQLVSIQSIWRYYPKHINLYFCYHCNINYKLVILIKSMGSEVNAMRLP